MDDFKGASPDLTWAVMLKYMLNLTHPDAHVLLLACMLHDVVAYHKHSWINLRQ